MSSAPSLSNNTNKLLNLDVGGIVFIKSLEYSDRLVSTVRTQDLDNIVGSKARLPLGNKRQPYPSCQSCSRGWVCPGPLNYCVGACRAKPVGIRLVRYKVAEKTCHLVAINSHSSKVARDPFAACRLSVAFRIADYHVLFSKQCSMRWMKVDRGVVKCHKSIVNVFRASKLDIIASVMVVNSDVRDEELFNEIEADP